MQNNHEVVGSLMSAQYNSSSRYRYIPITVLITPLSLNSYLLWLHSRWSRNAVRRRDHRGRGSADNNPRNLDMPKLYDNPEQEALHLNAMKSLAIETGHELAKVRQVYEVELARLQAGAHVREYVLLLSSRRARESLSKAAKPVPTQPVTA
jgi:hypothetical protein